MICRQIIRVILILSVFTVLYSCSDKKAEGLKELLDKNESQVSAMLIGEKGFESAKLEHLIARDYTKALNIIEKEEAEFNRIIKEIKNVNTDGIKMGKEVRQTSIDYYQALKDLFMFSRKEIKQEQLMRYGKSDKEIHEAQDQMTELGRQKQQLYQKVFKADEKRFTVQKQFETENNLD
ncbi:hypothetical protein [Chryseobacterium vrystaatense]|uniref:Cell-wall binding lipoprotein n=1 Tax=Chryseobacterium vrystaatense TaxID=307480 RepID=A0A1M5EJU5_9FLAO|nr:hypothetical protein [Chryseobacterium vrystaatense]SHF79495.1 hypothetical protein SAMN02787073_2942 [Chryseobacterium vrystaatense]